MNQPQFNVFLCHNSQDKPQVRSIAECLKKQGIRPWFDEWELRPGVRWQQVLEQQISQIESAAVFVGSNGLGPWQQQELRAFLQVFANNDKPLIPVLLTDASEKPELPLFLSERM
ncbi:MAG: toll/interleukin-1 receptor domain-containing protein [Nostoc sp. LLA-1]|nr:toll/interleukin-1 receptor domain-containing protein [Cyanocohniella sp. LLY]